MSPHGTQGEQGGGVLARLLAPLRLPERVIDALESLADAAPELGAMRSELVRVREQSAPLVELLPALERLEQSLGARVDTLGDVIERLASEESHLNQTVGELAAELEAMHQTIHGLQDHVEKITNHLPDPGRGPLEKARDALTGSGD